MRRFDLKGVKGVFANLRGSEKTSSKGENEVAENLLASDFFCGKMIRHGFPYHPTCMAWDPIQKLLAVGTKHGTVRLLGKPGVDLTMHHAKDVIVLQITFLINEGALITACSDDSIHLWNFRQKNPEIVNSLRFSRERITSLHLPFQSKWLYLGTERGNVHVVNVECFTVCGYTINWNKAIELARKTHPGPVVHLSDNPLDPNRLLIGFESGLVVCWDLRCRMAEFRFHCPESLRDACWHQEGKQFMCSHADGTLTIWNYRQQSKPVTTLAPHAKSSKSGAKIHNRPINRLSWKTMKNGEPYVIFSGGMSSEHPSKSPCLTLMHGKSVTVLEMEHQIVDFIVLCNSVYKHEFQDPYAIIVLLSSDLIFVDLTTPGYPCFQCPYALDIHESPVTCLKYFSDCASDLIPAFYSCGVKQKRKGLSEKEFPVAGGQWGSYACSYSEILITGHADGSVKFWDVSGINLQFLYKIKTSKLFSRSRNGDASRDSTSSEANRRDEDDDVFAIQHIYLDEESRLLTVAASQHIILFNFSKKEMVKELTVVDVTVLNEVYEELGETGNGEDNSPTHDHYQSTDKNLQLYRLKSKAITNQSFKVETCSSVRVKTSSRKCPVGYQPELVTLLRWCNGTPVPNITCVCVNSSYSLLAVGTTSSLVIVDIVQKMCVLNVLPTDLSNSNSLASRPPGPTSPKTRISGGGSVDENDKFNDQLSPVKEDINQSNLVSQPLTRAKSSSTSSIADESPTHTTPPPTQTKKHVALSKTFSDTTNLSATVPGASRPTNEKPSGMMNKLRRFSIKAQNAMPHKSSKSALAKPLTSQTSQPALSVFFVDQRDSTQSDGSNLQPESHPKTPADKPDGLTSRSRSSSSNSLDASANDIVQFIMFADGYTRKQDQGRRGWARAMAAVRNKNSGGQPTAPVSQQIETTPGMWVGTNNGNVIVMNLNLPGSERANQPIVISHSGSTYSLKGTVMELCFLDFKGLLIPVEAEVWTDGRNNSTEKREKRLVSRLSRTTLSSESTERVVDKQIAVIGTDCEIKTIALPSQTSLHKERVPESMFVVKAQAIIMKDSVCYACLGSNGNLLVYSLPSLRQLLNINYISQFDVRVARTLDFGNHGHALYMCTPTELQKLTISADTCRAQGDMQCEPFVAKENPEPPKQSFLKNLFGTAPSVLDREELFGTSGKASLGIATKTPGAALHASQANATGAAAEVARARQLLDERGEKLNQLDMRSEMMKERARDFAQNASQLAGKYRDSKWYQL